MGAVDLDDLARRVVRVFRDGGMVVLASPHRGGLRLVPVLPGGDGRLGWDTLVAAEDAMWVAERAVGIAAGAPVWRDVGPLSG